MKLWPLALLLLCAAEPDYTSPDHPWIERQHNVMGQSCCTNSDGYLLEEDEWRITPSGGAYEVLIKGKWYSIPPGVMRDSNGGPNPTGKAIVWWTSPYEDELGGLNGDSEPIHIWCFAPGTQF